MSEHPLYLITVSIYGKLVLISLQKYPLPQYTDASLTALTMLLQASVTCGHQVPLLHSIGDRRSGTGWLHQIQAVGWYQSCGPLLYAGLVPADCARFMRSADTSPAVNYSMQDWYRPIAPDSCGRPIPVLRSTIIRRTGTGRSHHIHAVGRYQSCDQLLYAEPVPADCIRFMWSADTNPAVYYYTQDWYRPIGPDSCGRPIPVLWSIIIRRTGTGRLHVVGQYQSCSQLLYAGLVPADCTRFILSADTSPAINYYTQDRYWLIAPDSCGRSIPVLRSTTLCRTGTGRLRQIHAVGRYQSCG
jgi:hypothetical protein